MRTIFLAVASYIHFQIKVIVNYPNTAVSHRGKKKVHLFLILFLFNFLTKVEYLFQSPREP